jgi:hypothetical protein
MRNGLILLLVVGILAPGLMAQEPPFLTKVLLPLAPRGVFPGALGSMWTTILSVTNTSDRPVVIAPWLGLCPITCDETPPTAPGSTFSPILTIKSEDTEGYFMHVEREFAHDVAFSLRAQDLSRQSLTWGTEIPVVREADFRTTRISLINVPLDDRFRQTLRIYDIGLAEPGSVEVRYFAIDPSQVSPNVADRLVLAQTVPFRYVNQPEFAFHPGYIQIDGLRAHPELDGVEFLRIDIVSVTEGLEFWAFVSVTNNETQHITVVTPQ